MTSKNSMAYANYKSMRVYQSKLGASVIIGILMFGSPQAAFACACGCGVFDIGGVNFAPSNSDSGWSAWFRYSSMDQNTNYQGTSKASPDDNSDKRIKTSFYTLGAQYMIDHEWGLMVEAPFFDRSFTTDPGSGVGTYHLSSLGDAQIQGMYTGFSPDHSTGLTFGLKLPTGEWRPKDPFDRDTMPGTGSTDLILGAYHFGSLTDDGRLSYFTQGKIDIPILTQNALGNSYRPGNEFDLSTGLTYDLASYGAFTKIAPLAQVLYSHKNRDSGTAAVSSDSGYDRIYVSPGLDVRIGKTKIYADVEIPVYTKVNFELPSDGGNGGQLVAPILYKIQIGYDF